MELYKRRLLEEMGLRRLAQALVLCVFTAPFLIWIVADFYILARMSDPPPFSEELFRLLRLPLTSDFASLGFVVTVAIPAAVAIVCYKFKPRQGTVPATIEEQLNRTGIISVGLCLVGIAISFVSMVLVTNNVENINMMLADSYGAIHGLAVTTFTFYVLYFMQFLGFSAK